MLCVLHFRISQRENVPLTFSLIRGAKKAGFAPATATLGKAKELPKEVETLAFGFGEESAEIAQVFLLLVKGLFDQEGILVGRPTTT